LLLLLSIDGAVSHHRSEASLLPLLIAAAHRQCFPHEVLPADLAAYSTAHRLSLSLPLLSFLHLLLSTGEITPHEQRLDKGEVAVGGARMPDDALSWAAALMAALAS